MNPHMQVMRETAAPPLFYCEMFVTVFNNKKKRIRRTYDLVIKITLVAVI